MAILKYCTEDPKTKERIWKVAIFPGIGGAGGDGSIGGVAGQPQVISGTATFSGCDSPTGTVINHDAGTLKYKILIIPAKNTGGSVGEYWIENKTETTFTVRNTGTSSKVKFDWIMVNSINGLIDTNKAFQEQVKHFDKQYSDVKKEVDNKASQKEVDTIEETLKGVATKGHTHKELYIAETNEINIANGFNNTDGTVKLNYKGTQKPILNLHICNGTKDGLAKITAASFMDENGNEVAYKSEIKDMSEQAEKALKIADGKQDKLTISNEINSDSKNNIATSYAVKTAYDKGAEALSRANEAHTKATNAYDLAAKKQDKLFITSSISSTSATDVANSNAVKLAYDNGTNAFNKAEEALKKANEAFQSASNNKEKLATAITGKGISASKDESFEELIKKVANIKSGEDLDSLLKTNKSVKTYSGDDYVWVNSEGYTTDIDLKCKEHKKFYFVHVIVTVISSLQKPSSGGSSSCHYDRFNYIYMTSDGYAYSNSYLRNTNQRPNTQSIEDSTYYSKADLNFETKKFSIKENSDKSHEYRWMDSIKIKEVWI